MAWTITIAAVLVVLAALGSRASLRRRLDRGAGDADPERAEVARQVARDIDRGRSARQGFL